ncbi:MULTISPECIES: hypothetical protein [Proteus]
MRTLGKNCDFPKRMYLSMRFVLLGKRKKLMSG